MGNGNRDPMVEALERARQRMSPAQRAAFDEQMNQAVHDVFNNFEAMGKTMVALELLHSDGAAEKAGFCAECGNVFPCQTRKFITPFVKPSAARP